MNADIRFISRAPGVEPYVAIVHGRQVYRRNNEPLAQFQARAEIVRAQILTSGWSQAQ